MLLGGESTWAIYALSVIVLVFIPPIALKDHSALVPFEILLFLAIPFTLKGMELGFVASHTLNYLSGAGIALLLVTELDTFTSFKTTKSFAVYFIAATTIAIAGLWALVRWISDELLDTSFILSENTLMWEFAVAAVAGIIGGKIFAVYLRKRDKELKEDEG